MAGQPVANLMRLILAFAIGFVGLSTVGVEDGRAQSSSVLEELKGANSNDLLSRPTRSTQPSDNLRNLSVAPSTAPADGADVVGRGREISPAERRDLLQNETRQAPADLTGNRERN